MHDSSAHILFCEFAICYVPVAVVECIVCMLQHMEQFQNAEEKFSYLFFLSSTTDI